MNKDNLREEWNKQAPENHDSIMKRLHEVTADWWLSKMSEQELRHQEEMKHRFIHETSLAFEAGQN